MVDRVPAATVLCVRVCRHPKPLQLDILSQLRQVGPDSDATSVQGLARDLLAGKVTINNTWEVLMGQSEVRNWYLSTDPSGPVPIMRYPGELKFPGGVQDPSDESLAHTAARELREEAGIKVPPESMKLRLFNCKDTKVVRGRAHRMHNFLAAEWENQWLQDIDVCAINQALAERRRECESLVLGRRMHLLSAKEREELCPEMNSFAWIPVGDAALSLMTSKSTSLLPVNAFQRDEFAKYAIYERDPMYQTMATLLELARCKSKKELFDACLESSKL